MPRAASPAERRGALAAIALLQIFAPNVLLELSHAFLQRMGLE